MLDIVRHCHLLFITRYLLERLQNLSMKSSHCNQLPTPGLYKAEASEESKSRNAKERIKICQELDARFREACSDTWSFKK